jgi:hypothetical protein
MAWLENTQAKYIAPVVTDFNIQNIVIGGAGTTNVTISENTKTIRLRCTVAFDLKLGTDIFPEAADTTVEYPLAGVGGRKFNGLTTISVQTAAGGTLYVLEFI